MLLEELLIVTGKRFLDTLSWERFFFGAGSSPSSAKLLAVSPLANPDP